MRPAIAPASVLACAALACLGGCGQEGPDAGGEEAGPREFTRVLELQVEAPAEGGLTVENLVGSFHVLPGEGVRLVQIRVTAHAGSQELADKLRLEQLPGEGDGALLVRVGYPLDEHVAYKYGDPRQTGSMWLDLVGGGRWTSGVEYAGRKVRVSNGRGTPLYTDVEVFLPARGVKAVFDNRIGGIEAREVAGNLSFSAGRWDLTLESVSGTVSVRTQSGDMTLESLDGSLSCVTGSGEVRINDFRDGSISCSTASGNVVADGAGGDLLEVTTASGDVLLEGVSTRRVRLTTASGKVTSMLGTMEEFKADTASGHIDFSSESLDLRIVEAGSVGGSIQLSLHPDLAFHARAVTENGRLENRFVDAEPVLEEGHLVGYRRGEGGAELDISAGHGDILLVPIH